MISGHSVISSILLVKISIYIYTRREKNSSQTSRLLFCLTAKNNAAQRDSVCVCACKHPECICVCMLCLPGGEGSSVC